MKNLYVRVSIVVFILVMILFGCKKSDTASSLPNSTPTFSQGGLPGSLKSFADAGGGETVFLYEFDFHNEQLSQSRSRSYDTINKDTIHNSTGVYNWINNDSVDVDVLILPNFNPIPSYSFHYSLDDGKLMNHRFRFQNLETVTRFVYNDMSGDLETVFWGTGSDSVDTKFNIQVDAKGNISQITLNEDQNVTVFNYTFDNHPNPLKGLLGLFSIPGPWEEHIAQGNLTFFNNNNVISCTKTVNNIPEGNTVYFSYLYDISGKPTRYQSSAGGKEIRFYYN